MSPRNQAIWHRIRSVFAKELRDHSRDKRSVFLSMVFPLLAPVMLGLLLANLGKGIEKAPEAGEGGELPPSIAYVQGSEFAPALMAYLKEQNVSIRPAPEGVSAQASAVRRGRIPFVLIIPPENEGKSRFPISIVLDRNNARSTVGSRDLVTKIDDFNKASFISVMQAQGINPNELTPVTVREKNVGRAQNSAYVFYNMIPSLAMFMIFMGAVYLAIDTTVENASVVPWNRC